MATDELADYLDAAVNAARLGAAVLEEWRTRFNVREKGRFDLVTEADVGSQQAIRGYLQERFPEHAFVGEEDPASQRKPGPGAPPTWIVDPLDGTTNYVHDCPIYCVSIGLQVGGELVVGVVYDPRQNEMFTAAKGRGASLNGRPIHVSQTGTLDQALLATGFPTDLRGQERALAWWRHFSLITRSLRRTGSTALNLAYVAAGRFDGYWAFDNNAWDVAGGVVLVREAGGLVTNADGAEYDAFTPDCLAANPGLYRVMLDVLRTGPAEKRGLDP
jgi:myo-inositol-1(or 4)-monophosphatase